MKKVIILIMTIAIIIVGFYGFNNYIYNEKQADPSFFTSETLIVNTPAINQVVTSPLTVVGEATGTWYFEASFPIEIISSDGTQLGQSFVQAQDDWMTENLVPFEGQITFDVQGYTKGFLVIHRDNPSGLPEHDKSEQIPIQFGQ